jgi:glycosyltransferase involved in cell wall biosynthesis
MSLPSPLNGSEEMKGEMSLSLGMERKALPFVSLVIPVFDEENSLEPFISAATQALVALRLRFELLFINDGSRDQTLARMIALSANNSTIRIVNLSRHFSKEAALMAGLDCARGDVVIPIDVDLQDPPELIGKFIEFWRKGYDVVYGLRTDRDGDPFSKRLTSKLFYKIFNCLSEVKIPEDVGDFRLIDRRVVDVLKILPERNRFMKGLFAWTGFRSIGVPYVRPERRSGATKWNYWRLCHSAVDGLINSTTLPLRISTYAGLFIVLASLVSAGVILYRLFVLSINVPNFISLATAIFFVGGIQLLSLGVIGEYLGRLFMEVKRRPAYLIDGVYESGALKNLDGARGD